MHMVSQFFNGCSHRCIMPRFCIICVLHLFMLEHYQFMIKEVNSQQPMMGFAMVNCLSCLRMVTRYGASHCGHIAELLLYCCYLKKNGAHGIPTPPVGYPSQNGFIPKGHMAKPLLPLVVPSRTVATQGGTHDETTSPIAYPSQNCGISLRTHGETTLPIGYPC